MVFTKITRNVCCILELKRFVCSGDSHYALGATKRKILHSLLKQITLDISQPATWFYYFQAENLCVCVQAFNHN